MVRIVNSVYLPTDTQKPIKYSIVAKNGFNLYTFGDLRWIIFWSRHELNEKRWFYVVIMLRFYDIFCPKHNHVGYPADGYCTGKMHAKKIVFRIVSGSAALGWWILGDDAVMQLHDHYNALNVFEDGQGRGVFYVRDGNFYDAGKGSSERVECIKWSPAGPTFVSTKHVIIDFSKGIHDG